MMPARLIKEKAEEYKALFQTLAVLVGEDSSKHNFGHNIPKELNAAMVRVARQFQELIGPLEELRESISSAVQAKAK